MNTVTKTYDTNAHISDLQWVLEKSSVGTLAKISFRNVSQKTITGVRFDAMAFDYFRDQLLFGGNPKFCVSVQNISIAPGRELRDYYAALPSKEIDLLTLEERKVRFEDVSFEVSKEAHYCTVTLQEYDENSSQEKKLLKELRDHYGEKFKYVPQEINEGWICGCGYYNTLDVFHCPNCNRSKEDIFKSTESDYQQQLAQKYRKSKFFAVL